MKSVVKRFLVRFFIEFCFFHFSVLQKSSRGAMKFNLSTTDATDPRGLLCGREANMRSSFFCICLDRCGSMAKACELRPVLSGIWGQEPAAATSHRYGRLPRKSLRSLPRSLPLGEARTGEIGQVDQVQTCRNAMKQGTWSIVSNLANFFCGTPCD